MSNKFFEHQEVVGESFHDAALRETIRAHYLYPGPPADSGELTVPALLVPRPDNQNDPNAIAVEIDGRRVGWIPRGNTAAYHAAMNRRGLPCLPAVARVGWGEGRIGVRVIWEKSTLDDDSAEATPRPTAAVDLPPPHEVEAPAPAGWYRDPDKKRRQRWWDGAGWTDYYATNWIARCDCGWMRGDPNMTSDDAFWAAAHHAKANPGPDHRRYLQRRDGERFRDLGVYTG